MTRGLQGMMYAFSSASYVLIMNVIIMFWTDYAKIKKHRQIFKFFL